MKVIVLIRVYFYLVLSDVCKIKDLFMIKNDYIIVYGIYDDG